MVKRHGQLMLVLLGVADVVVAALAWVVAYGVRIVIAQIGLTEQPLMPPSFYAPSMLLSLLLAVLTYGRFGLYEPKRTKDLASEITNTLRAVFVVWGLTYVIINYVHREAVPRTLMLPVLVVWLVLACANRLAGRELLRWVRRRGLNLRYAAIVGSGRLGQTLYHNLRRNSWTGIEPVYFIDDSDRTELMGLKVRGPLKDIDRILAENPADMAFLALPGAQHEQLEQTLDRLALCNVDVRIVPDLLSFHFLQHDVSLLDNLPVITLTHSPQHGFQGLLKRAFDLAFAAFCIVVLAAPMGLIALVIKLTGTGPVFFRQERMSLGGKAFMMYKFRTMVVDAEAATGPVWASPDDTRTTRVGRFLRRASLDELPQVFNVLRGDMSMVGPRPERPEFIERFRHQVPRYMLRHHVKAGITGWAQVHGLRGRTSLLRRVRYDLYYINRWSFGLDMLILLMTPFRGLANPNAY